MRKWFRTWLRNWFCDGHISHGLHAFGPWCQLPRVGSCWEHRRCLRCRQSQWRPSLHQQGWRVENLAREIAGAAWVGEVGRDEYVGQHWQKYVPHAEAAILYMSSQNNGGER